MSVTWQGADKLEAILTKELPAKARKAFAAAMYQEGESIMAKSKRKVPVDMGALRASGHVQPPKIAGSAVSVTLAYGTEYAVFVHEGTRPHFPPLEAIEPWARRHGVEPFLVARAIAQRGTEPKKYLEEPLMEAARGMEGRLAGRVKAALQ